MSIAAIVPVWNGRELLEQLLRTLAAQTLPAAEIVVVDNGSTDGAPDAARAAGARVIAMGRNAGFAAAVNRGIRESSGEWVAVLNSDVELAPDYFEKLSAATGWFATGKILRTASATIDGTYDLVSRAGTAWRVGNARPDGPLFGSRVPIFSPPWTAALFRRELFDRTGYLEESFESYLEDVEFGLRCARKKLAGEYIPQAVAWHRGSASLGRWHPDTVRRISRNQVLLVAKHYARMPLWPIVAGQLLWGAVALRHGAGWAWMRGKFEGWHGFGAARRKGEAGDPAVLVELLHAQEREIFRIQAAAGFDTYWRLYFRVAGEAF